jgi:hypothetical protein
MCELDMASLLHRLFHEEVLEVFTVKAFIMNVSKSVNALKTLSLILVKRRLENY